MSDLSPEEKFALTPEEEEFWSGERGLKQNLGQEAYKILSDYLSPKDKKSMLSSADVQPHGWRDQDPRIKRAQMYLNAARKKKEENAAKEKKAAEDKLIAMPKSAAYTEAIAEAVRIIKDAYENAKQKEVIVNKSKPQQQKKKNHKFKEQRDMWVYTDDYYENAEIQTHASQNNVISRSGEFFKFLFFDTYIREGRGANFFKIATMFRDYLSSKSITNIETSNRIRISSVINTSVLKTFNDLFYEERLWEQINYNYDKFYEYLTTHGNYIFLSGWSAKGGGHAITIYIEKKEDNKHTVYIVNSGAGLGYHGERNAKGEYPIIIKFDNIDIEKVEAIYNINSFFNKDVAAFQYYRDSGLEKYNDLLEEDKPNPKFESVDGKGNKEVEYIFNTYIKSSYTKKDKIGADLFYRCMFTILKDKQIYKYDKEQMSGSCTYFSTYYFVKCMIFTETNEVLFSTFMKSIKNLHANAFLLNYTNELTPNDKNDFSIDKNRRLSTIAPALLKDRDISPLIKEKIANLLKGSYTHERLIIYTKSNDTPYKGLFDNFIKLAEEFMNGKKTIKKIKEILLQYNDDGFTFSIDDKHSSLIKDLFYIVSIRCLLECYHSIGKENGEEIIPFTTKENYEITFYRSDIYKDIIEIMVKMKTNLNNPGSFNQITMYKNILIQCLFKSMPMPSTEEFPFNERVEVIYNNKTIYIDDKSIKKIIMEEYIDSSNPFLYNYSFRNLYSELFRRRGLLLLNSRDSNTYDLEGYHNRVVFYKYIQIWILNNSYSELIKSGLTEDRYTEYIDKYTDGINSYLYGRSKRKDELNCITAYLYNNFPYDRIESYKSDEIISLAKIITSGNQFSSTQYQVMSQYNYIISERNRFIDHYKDLGIYKDKQKSKLNNSKIMTISYTLNNIISSINFGSVDDMELKDLNVFINESPSSEIPENIGYDLYEFENISNTQKEGPPVISLEKYIRNHFIVDKRNDMLKYIVDRLDLEQFKKLAGKLPIEVYENLLYLLYIYKYDFVIENRDILKVSLSPESRMRNVLDGHISYIYMSMLKKKKNGVEDIYPKEMDDYFIQNIFNSSPLNIVINNVKELACEQPRQGYYLNNDIEILKQFSSKLKIYSPLEDKNKFFYFKENTPYEITIEGDSILVTDGGKKYKYTEIDTIDNMNIDIIYNKINFCIHSLSSPIVWKHVESDTYRVECDEIDGWYFEIIEDRVTYIDTINNKTYTVKLIYTMNEGIWTYLTVNSFLIENDEGTKILLFMTDNIISEYINSYNHLFNNERFWDTFNSSDDLILNSYLNEMKKIKVVNKISIINLHYTCLSVDTSIYDDYIALFISYQLFGNGLALSLLFSKMNNLIGMDPKSMETSQYKEYDYKYFKDKMDIYIWGLYLDKNHDDNSPRRIEINRFEMLSESDMNINLEELLKNPNYKLIAKMSRRFECIQKVVEFPSHINAKEDAPLRKFIKEFRYLCDKQADKCEPLNNVKAREEIGETEADRLEAEAASLEAEANRLETQIDEMNEEEKEDLARKLDPNRNRILKEILDEAFSRGVSIAKQEGVSKWADQQEAGRKAAEETRREHEESSRIYAIEDASRARAQEKEQRLRVEIRERLEKDPVMQSIMATEFSRGVSEGAMRGMDSDGQQSLGRAYARNALYAHMSDILKTEMIKKDHRNISNIFMLREKAEIKRTEAARLRITDNIQERFFSLILNEHFPSIPLLYARHWKAFYTKLIDMKYRRIKSTLDAVKDTDNDDLCGFIIKMIEPLDPLLIYGWNKPRQIEDLLFELQTGNFIRAKQKSILEAIYNQDHINSIVANEILMGQGKTSTLTPLIILNRYYQKAIRYFTVVLPSHLVQPSYEILFDMINIMPTITVNRNINNFTGMRDKVLHIMSDVTIKTIVLKGIKSVENLVDVPKGVCHDKTEEPAFSKITSNENDFYIFDEVDSLLNPLKSDLNIPKPPQIDHKKRKDIFRICFHSLKNLFTGSTPTINDSDTVKIKHPRLKDTYIYSEAYSGDDRDLIAPIFNTKISDTLLHTLSMVYNQNYGFGSLNKDKKWTCSKNHFVAIPYSANLTPVEDSEFTDYELFIILSIYCYFSNEIRPIDVSIVVDIMAKKIMGFGSLTNDPELLQNIYLSLYPTLSKSLGPTFIDIFNKKKASTNYDAECEKIAKEMSSEAERKYDFIEYYLGTIIFERFAKIYVEQSNISMVDIFDPSISSQKVTFSGTVNMNLPGDIIKNLLETSSSFESGQISEIQKDDTVGPAIELAFYGITTRVPQLYYNENDDKEAKLIQHIIENINTNTYQALIDTAGILLKTTPEQLIQKINEALVDRTKVLMYVTKEDVRKVMVDGVVRNYKNETFDNLFIYYDHKHCVGTDFKQPFKMHGLVTIDTKNNLTEIAQGIFRLRFINIGHSVDFYIIARKPAVNNIRKQNQQLFNYLVEKDKQFITNSTKPSSLQCSKYVYRRQQKAEVNSYTEQIFFETLLTDNYKNYAEYINFNFQRYQASGLRFKSGIVKALSDKNPSHTAVNLQIAEEIAEEVAVSTEIAVAKISLMGMPRKPKENDMEMTLDDYLAFHSNNKFTKNNSITDETGTVWNLFVSRPVEYKIIANLYYVDNDDDNQWFYFTVNDSPNSILLLCYYEVVVLLNHLGDNPNIAITDWYGQSFTKTKKEFPRVIRLLLAHKSYDIYNQLASLKVYCSKNGDADTSSIRLSDGTEGTEVKSEGRPLTKIECLDYYFGFKYPFRDFKCNNEPDWTKPDAWTSYLQFPAAVSETLKTAVIETLIKKYALWSATQVWRGGRRIQGRRLKKTRKGSTSRRRRVTRKQ